MSAMRLIVCQVLRVHGFSLPSGQPIDPWMTGSPRRWGKAKGRGGKPLPCSRSWMNARSVRGGAPRLIQSRLVKPPIPTHCHHDIRSVPRFQPGALRLPWPGEARPDGYRRATVTLGRIPLMAADEGYLLDNQQAESMERFDALSELFNPTTVPPPEKIWASSPAGGYGRWGPVVRASRPGWPGRWDPGATSWRPTSTPHGSRREDGGRLRRPPP